MADVVLPAPGGDRTAWLDRPVIPAWLRLGVVAAHREELAFGTIVLIGFLLRIWDVGARAMHHDESLHAYYAWQFFVGQGYAYDPLMHGPLQFEVAPIFYLVFGAGEFSARLLAVVLGTALIGLPFLMRSYLTRPGALLASVMIAISPSLVYFSRFIRDDIYLAFFSLLLFICIVRYIGTHENRYVYIGAVMMSLALASMEAAYITFFIFGTFVVFAALREYLGNRSGPVLTALKSISFDTWLTATAVFVVLTVVFYSTFFTNPDGIWDMHHSLTSPDRKDILGGLTYWKAQHSVQRGGQPWFYYFLVIPAYEQLAVLFGLAGLVYAAVRRSLVTTFLAWWAVTAFGLYSWAGEKMPWLSIHITLPLILLAALFVGSVLRRGILRWLIPVVTAFVLLLVLEVHSSFALNFQDPANPTEMLIYVQTSQDVPNVAHEVASIARTHGGTAMPIGLDDADVGGWPFQWYLRDYTNITETTTFNGPTCAGQYCPVLIMLQDEYTPNSSTLLKHYVAQKYRWNWWFPEDYKDWFPQHVGSIARALEGKSALDPAPFGTSTDWQHVWNWLVYRTPFGDRGARSMYFLVRRDLVPGAHYFPTSGTNPIASGPNLPTSETFGRLSATLRFSAGGSGVLSGPRGLAADRHGYLYVADTLNHRVVKISPAGKIVSHFGSAGTQPGQFSQRDSPQGIAIGPDGHVYVADTWNQRIEVFSPAGKYLRSWGGGDIGTNPGQFYGPRSVAVSASGTVYVADTGNKRIQVFSSSGHYLSSWGSAGSGQGQFQEPSAVAIGPRGTVYAADFWNQRIQVFTPSGAYIRSWPVTDWSPQSYDEPYLAIDERSGTIYASDPSQQRILAWTAAGRPLGEFAGPGLTLPIGLAAGPLGVAVGDPTAGTISVFSVHTAQAKPAKPHR